MHPRRNNTELWIGANWLARTLGINSKNVWYWAIKMRLRFFKFSGVRYIEKEDAICLVNVLADRFPFDKNDALDKIDKYHS